MEEYFKELAKHYLGIAAAILVALLIGIIVKEFKIGFLSIILGAFVYFMFLAISFLMFLYSRKIKEKRGK